MEKEDKQVGPSEAKFKINIKEGIVEIEGTDTFVERHLEKFEEICKSAIQDVVSRRLSGIKKSDSKYTLGENSRPRGFMSIITPRAKATSNHLNRPHLALPPIPVDLKGSHNKIGLREFYNQKRPSNHYEKTAVFVYYLTKFNRQSEIKFGEILSCYDEVGEKKPSIIDIVKNSIRYKGWLDQGSGKFTAVLTISGENFVGFDLPHNKDHIPSVLEQNTRDLICK
ncbi:MAG TPA: hypothetical protein VE572_05945 [Nitrososphaeraceae archaeon]|nr:hypothetical protein [Nitrososphaeraceae archaeon]